MSAFRHARLARPHEYLPWNGRAFGHGSDIPGFERVDPLDGFVLSLIRDGSLVFEDPPQDPAPADQLPHADP